MNKPTIVIAVLLFAAISAFANADGKVDVVVAGAINHGPMQPTVNAIKEVVSKYGDNVSVSWVDYDTAEGQKYYQEHGLSAHLNILINGKYTQNLAGRTVTFQWFEGGSWTKKDLDEAIAVKLGGSNTSAPEDLSAETPTPNEGGGNPSVRNDYLVPTILLLAALLCVAVFLLIRRRKK